MPGFTGNAYIKIMFPTGRSWFLCDYLLLRWASPTAGICQKARLLLITLISNESGALSQQHLGKTLMHSENTI